MRRLRKFAGEKFCYEFTRKELIWGILEGILSILATSVLFFDHWIAVVFLTPYLHFYLKRKEGQKKKKEQMMTSAQFKDGMLAISTALAAGYSVENSFREAAQELDQLYGETSVMMKEFKKIARKIEFNENVEDALEEMAGQLNLEEAVYFAEVFRFAKRSGGNLIEIITKTARNISDKISVREDIDVLISGRKMEQKIMNLMPFGIIAYLRMGAYEFISPMYGNILGICVMAVCLVLYMAARMLSEKIVEINV